LRIRSSSLNIIHELGGMRIQRSSSAAELMDSEEKIEVRRIGALRIKIRASSSNKIDELRGIIERRIP